MLFLPPSGSADPNASYIGKNLTTGTMGSRVPRGAIENPQRELIALIQASGQTPTNDDLAQVLRAVRSGRLAFYPDTSGASNALVVAPSPVHLAYVDGLHLRVKVANRNTGAVTLKLNALAAVPVVNNESAGQLVGGEMASGKLVDVVYDAAISAFRLLTPMRSGFNAGGSFGVGGTFGSTGTTNWLVPDGVTKVRARCWGGGGGGGGCQASPSAASGGGGGGYTDGFYQVTPGTIIPVTAGAGGAPGSGGANNAGTAGGASSFGSFCTAGGGQPGLGAATNGYQATAGSGGTASGGNIFNVAGTNGGAGALIGSSASGLGGGGGNSFTSAGSPPTVGGATAGSTPGGGGAGGANGGTGGAAGPGIVLLDW